MLPKGLARRHVGDDRRRASAVTRPCDSRGRLLSQSQLSDDRSISLVVVARAIRQVTTALTDQLEQPAARAVVALVHFQVLDELVDPLGQERDLHVRGARVRAGDTVLFNDLRLLFFAQRHAALSPLVPTDLVSVLARVV